MANVFVTVAHSADNKTLVATRGATLRMAAPETNLSDFPTSFMAASAFLKEWGVDAQPVELERVPRKESPAFPYVVRVRCLRT